MSPAERALFVRWLAGTALSQALDAIADERAVAEKSAAGIKVS
jgi:hypothetical protein